MRAIHLRTEYLENPIGVDIVKPRFYWNCTEGIKQTAYQIIAKTENDQILWDSTKVESNHMVHIPYEGKQLKSRDIVSWKVKLWDENRIEGDWSDIASFEMGLLHPQDWKAKWITGNYQPTRKKRYPVDCFLKEIRVDKAVKKARIYLTACGLYEAKMNQNKVGSFCFAPGFTDYRKRLQYQVYDVTSLLNQGTNKLELELADGWYRGSIGAMGVTSFYGEETKLLCQLEITYEDGQRQCVVSDDSFSWSNDGSICFADLKDGEHVKASKMPSYQGKAKLTNFALVPSASNNVPVECHEVFSPKLKKSSSGKKVLDFGQNISGVIAFRVNAKAGQKIYLQCGEVLDDKGDINMSSIQCVHKGKTTPLQEIKYICKEGINEYVMRFAVFGFQYALLESEAEIKTEDIKAIAVYSSMEETGSFECSNQLVNKLLDNTRWSLKGNFLDVPTDCPTRERAGWTGDAQIFFKTGSYLMNTAPFFRKWMIDLQDRQTTDGKVHCIVPSIGNEGYVGRMDGCVGWADAAILIPYRYWKMYGDRTFLEECYPSMKAYAKFMISRTNRTGFMGKAIKGPDKKYIYNVGQQFGEWLEPKDVYKQSIIKDFVSPHPEEGTAYLVWSMEHMMEIAEELGMKEDYSLYKEYYTNSKKAYSNQFVKGEKIDTDRHSKLVRPLAMHLLEETAKKNVLERLLSCIHKRNYRIGTGFLSTPLMLPMLTEQGYLEDAYQMLEQEGTPGWLYEVKHGATTIWEDWEGHASRNHYSPGSVCEWLFTTVGGIKIGEEENSFIICPQPGGSLNYCNCEYQSIYGKVSCNWKKSSKGYQYEIVVPANTTATILYPDGKKEVVGSGVKIRRFGAESMVNE